MPKIQIQDTVPKVGSTVWISSTEDATCECDGEQFCYPCVREAKVIKGSKDPNWVSVKYPCGTARCVSLINQWPTKEAACKRLKLPLKEVVPELCPNCADYVEHAVKNSEPEIVKAMSWLEDECYDIRCESVQTSMDDYSVQWVIYSHYEQEPKLRPEGRGDTILAALQDSQKEK